MERSTHSIMSLERSNALWYVTHAERTSWDACVSGLGGCRGAWMWGAVLHVSSGVRGGAPSTEVLGGWGLDVVVYLSSGVRGCAPSVRAVGHEGGSGLSTFTRTARQAAWVAG